MTLHILLTDEHASMRESMRVLIDCQPGMEVVAEAARQEMEIKAGEGTVIEKDKAPSRPRKLILPPIPTDLQPLYRGMLLEFLFERVQGASSYTNEVEINQK